MSSEAGGAIVGIAAGAIVVSCGAFVLAGAAGVGLAVETTSAAALALKGLYLLAGDLRETVARERAAALERRRTARRQAARDEALAADARARAAALAAFDGLESRLEALESNEQAQLMLAAEIAEARAIAESTSSPDELASADARLAQATERALAVAAHGESEMLGLVAASALAVVGFEDVATRHTGGRTVVTGFRGGQVATVATDGSTFGVDLSRSGFRDQEACDATLEQILAELNRHGLVLDLGMRRPHDRGSVADLLSRAASDVAGQPAVVESTDGETVIRASIEQGDGH